ncbi:MAG: hypothetical protein AB1656_00705 [Candidatus Omnitrophota bacterium]
MRIFDPAYRKVIEAAHSLVAVETWAPRLVAAVEKWARVQRLLEAATVVTAAETERVRKTHPTWSAAAAVAEALDAKVNAEVNTAMRATLYEINETLAEMNSVERRILNAIVPPLDAAVAALDAMQYEIAMRKEIAKAKGDLAVNAELNAAVAALDAMRYEIAKAKRDLEGEMANLE